MNPLVTRSSPLAVLLMLSVVISLAGWLQAYPGNYDPSFGAGGAVTTDLGGDDGAKGMAIQSDGKIVVVGSAWVEAEQRDKFAVTRYNTDGSLDTTFSGDGKLVTGVGSDDSYATCVAIQSDGKIVVAGYYWVTDEYDFAVARYHPNGSLDTTFSGNGLSTANVTDGNNDYAYGVAIQSNGRIVVVGSTDSGTSNVAVVRLLTDGAYDTSFSSDGKTTTDVSSTDDHARSVAIQSDGKIVVAGYYNPTSSTQQFLVIRYNSSGTLDTSFDGNGMVDTVIRGTENWDGASGLAIQSDGKIVVAGWSWTADGSHSDFAVVRYNSNGSQDTTFDGDGKLTTDLFGGYTEWAYSVAMQGDGKIVVAGQAAGGFGVARYLSNGALDTSFNFNGWVSRFFSSSSRAWGVAVQSDGKIVAAGETYSSSWLGTFPIDTVVARFLGDAPPQVSTSTATAITLSGATLRGTVNPDGIATTATFQYGLTTSYGSTVSVTLSPNNGTSVESVSAGISGLASNTTYHYRIVATNSAGTTNGNDQTFTTLTAPVISNVSAVPVGGGGGGFQVTGQINPNSLPTTMMVEYGTSAALGSSLAAGTFSGSTTQSFSSTPYPAGLTWGTTYYYRVVATNANGTTTTAIQTVVYAAGARDFTFGGGDGIQITPIVGEESGQGVAVQSDGKVVVVGYSRVGATDDFTVVRYNTDGTLDTSFGGGDGIATVDFASQHDFAYAVAIQPDGKIVVAGETPQSGAVFALARLHGDAATGVPGTLDNSFDGDGKTTTDFNLNDVPSTIAVLPNGQILVGGYSLIGSTADFAIARYNANGSLDTAGFGATGTTFTGGGKVTTAIGPGDDYGNMALMPDGRIVMAGRSSNGSNTDFSVALYLSDGRLDVSFDGDGKRMTPIGGGDDGGSKVAVQSDGKIVVAGYAGIGGNFDFAVVRYLANGTPDPTFDTDGIVTTAIGSAGDLGRGIAIQRDGRLVVAGETHNGSNNDFAVVRYNPDGTLDATFNGNGKVTTAIGSGDEVSRGVALQPDGNIVVVGRSHNGTDNDIAVVRYLAGPMPLLVNGGFESNEALGGTLPTGFGDWAQDQASTVTAESGITPYEGTRMVKFIGTGLTGAGGSAGCDVAQYVDLSAYAALIAQGNVSVTATARVNRVAGNASTDTRFALYLATRSGTPAGTNALTNEGESTVISDGNVATWELVTTTLTVPAGSTYLVVDVVADENVLNNTSAPEFDGHYADDVTLTVTVGPDIQLEQPVGTILVDGVSTVAFGTTPLGTPVTRTFRVTNTGGQSLNVTGLTLPPVYEHVGSFAPFTLAPDATQDFTVRFLANTVTGNFNGTMTLTSDDPDAEGSFAVGLTGRAARVYPGAMAIKVNNPTAPSGIYTLDPDGPGGGAPFDAYCDMTSFGGGWTLLLKADGGQSTFQQGASLWTDTSVLNTSSPGMDNVEFKSPGFSTVPYNAIMVALNTGGTLRRLQMSFSSSPAYSSLRAMFLGGEVVAINSRAEWLGLTSPASAFDSQNGQSRGGINIAALHPDFPRIRIGMLMNNEADMVSPDSFIGIGASSHLGTLTTTSGGANYVASYHAPAMGYVFVRDTTGGIFPAYAPTLTTTAATSVGATTATLNGTVNPNGIITSAWFEWGETTSYGITTGAEAVGYGTNVVFKSESISGLIPGRTIHYRLVAQNGEATVYGADMTFTTADNVAPAGGLMSLSPGSPFDPSTPLTVSFSGWSDDSLPLTYMVLIDNIVVSPRGSAASRNFTGPATPGTYTLKGRIYDAFDNMAEVTQSFTVNTPAESWRLLHFGTTSDTGNAASTADPDGDGLNNLLERAFGTDPTVHSSGVIVVSGGVIVQHGAPTVRVQNIPNSVDFRALFGRRKDHAASGLIYTVQFSADLGTWQTSTTTPTIIADDGEIEACTVPYPFFINGKKARFFRVSVNTAP